MAGDALATRDASASDLLARPSTAAPAAATAAAAAAVASPHVAHTFQREALRATAASAMFIDAHLAPLTLIIDPGAAGADVLSAGLGDLSVQMLPPPLACGGGGGGGGGSGSSMPPPPPR